MLGDNGDEDGKEDTNDRPRHPDVARCLVDRQLRLTCVNWWNDYEARSSRRSSIATNSG